MRLRYKYLIALFWLFLFIISGIFVFHWYRPNNSYVNKRLNIELWEVVNDGHHNAFMDMVYWRNRFYLVYRSAQTHIDLNSELIIIKSKDAENWEKVATLKLKDADIRDPKFLVFNDTLFLYVLKNVDPFAEPYTTLFSYSHDGEDWKDFEDAWPKGYMYWRPKVKDGVIYVAAHKDNYKKSILLNSTDGKHWQKIGTIYKEDIHSEVAISFLPDGRMICASRIEGSAIIPFTGDSSACTLIGISDPPYDDWDFKKEYITKLDGPVLFSNENDNKTYAIGRFEPDARGIITQTGSQFSRKRTSIFQLKKDSLIYLSDLPSGGDTSYPSIVRKGKYLYICYYSNNIEKDPFWLMGEMTSTVILMAKIELDDLEYVAKHSPKLHPQGLALDNIFLLSLIGLIGIACLRISKPWKKFHKKRNKI